MKDNILTVSNSELAHMSDSEITELVNRVEDKGICVVFESEKLHLIYNSGKFKIFDRFRSENTNLPVFISKNPVKVVEQLCYDRDIFRSNLSV